MNEIKTTVSRWILFVSAIVAIMEIGLSIMLCLSPGSVVDNVDLSTQGVMYLIYMWASRQFALGVIFAWATYKRSAAMLSLAYIFLLVVFASDVLIAFTEGDTSFILAALVMCINSVVMILVLNRGNSTGNSLVTSE